MLHPVCKTKQVIGDLQMQLFAPATSGPLNLDSGSWDWKYGSQVLPYILDDSSVMVSIINFPYMSISYGTEGIWIVSSKLLNVVATTKYCRDASIKCGGRLNLAYN
jgi:hypothetical protein